MSSHCSPALAIKSLTLGISCALNALAAPAQATAPAEIKPGEIAVCGSRITVQVAPGALAMPRAQIMEWIKRSATAASCYYGRFPVQNATIRVVPFAGNGFGFATTDSEQGHGLIVIPLGDNTTQKKFDRDWVLTHEMCHLAFPLVYPKHRWLVEGMATYIEPIARMQAGYITKEEMWGDLYKDLPKGLPQPGDGGLNENSSWGRVYWGGALFCFMADLEIRKQTHNKMGLQNVLQAVDRTNGDITSDMEVEEALIVGDKAIGPKSHLFRDLFASMSNKASAQDLEKIWTELGVKKEGQRVTFNDSAPLSAVRKAIESGT